MKYLPVIISIVLAQLAGIIGSFFTFPAIPTWYASLEKPSWNPPSFIFGPVWTILYVLMGIASYIVWKEKNSSFRRLALSIYAVQLALNALWSIIFFGLKNPQAAFYEIIFLWIFIVLTLVLFWRINKLAGILLVPYLTWVTFAAYLNFSIWQLN